MDITFVAFESLGVRSQATFIQTKDANIFIDPSAALAPKRYGLPPHIYEVEKLIESFNKIEKLLGDSNIIIYTHYHYDHHEPGRFIDPTLYKGKTIFIKDPHNNINISQRIRAHKFLKTINKMADRLYIADGRSVTLGTTKLYFSKPLPHGESDRLGYVISICVDDGSDIVLYTSDIEGGPSKVHRELIDFCKARVAIVDGPPTYLLNYRYSEHGLKMSKEFIFHLLEVGAVELIVLDHHVCRDLNYVEIIAEIFKKAKEKGKQVKTVAEVIGVKPLFLEAMRRELYKEKPVSGLKLLIPRYRSDEYEE